MKIKEIGRGLVGSGMLAMSFFSYADDSEVKDIAKKSGCFACHSIEHKLVGPAWREVSKRYHDDETARAKLIEKVKKGGSGNWTDITGGMPMPPNSPRVADEVIEKLVDFILAIEK